VQDIGFVRAVASQLRMPYYSLLSAVRTALLVLSGAGRIGACNGAPFATGNWSSFWDVAAAGSWLELVLDAGHLQFADVSSLLDWVCCSSC
jgi:hypothetical protein